MTTNYSKTASIQNIYFILKLFIEKLIKDVQQNNSIVVSHFINKICKHCRIFFDIGVNGFGIA